MRCHGAAWLRRVAVGIVSAVLLTGCAGVAASGSGSAGDGTGQADPDATVRVAITVPPTQNDPLAIKNENGNVPYFTPMNDTLIGLDENGDLIPLLAESWERSDDEMSMTLKLRQGAVFHDGTPIDAAAVVANLQRALDSDNAIVETKVGRVASVTASDPQTVVLTLSEKEPLLEMNLVSIALGMISPSSFAQAATNPVGSGPYRFVSQGADRVTYERFDEYWDPNRGANAAQLVMQAIPDAGSRVNALRSGQIDMAVVDATMAADVASLTQDPRFEESWNETQTTSAMYLHIGRGQLADPNVRRALHYAVDRQSLDAALTGGHCPPTSQPFPTGAGHVPDLDESYPFDQDRAKALLAEAGVSNLALKGIAASNQLSQLHAKALQAQFADVGVTLDITTVPAGDSYSLFREGGQDFLILPIVGDPDPARTISTNYLGLNSPGGAPPEVRAAGERAMAFGVDDPERVAALEEFSRTVVENPIHLNICAYHAGWAYRSELVGIDTMPWRTVSQYTDSRTLGIIK